MDKLLEKFGSRKLLVTGGTAAAVIALVRELPWQGQVIVILGLILLAAVYVWRQGRVDEAKAERAQGDGEIEARGEAAKARRKLAERDKAAKADAAEFVRQIAAKDAELARWVAYADDLEASGKSAPGRPATPKKQ